MPENLLTQNTDLNVRKIVGRSHLKANRLDQALEVYAGIMLDYPEDLEATLAMADLCLASSDRNAARYFYQRALELDPQNDEIASQVEMVNAAVFGVEAVPTEAQDVGDMIQKLTGRASPVTEEELEQAATLLQNILQSTQPAEAVAECLDEIDNLLPALIELNIRQARSDGRQDLVEALQNLQLNISLQLKNNQIKPAAPAIQLGGLPGKSQRKPHFCGSALLLVPNPQEPSRRMLLANESLIALGCEVTIAGEFSSDIENKRFDIIIVSNPLLIHKLLESMAAATALHIPIILDLDEDFEHMPITHSNYELEGLGTTVNARLYNAALLLADLISVPSQLQAESLRSAGYPVCVIPDGWSKRNPLWNRPAPQRNTINIGWVGTQDGVQDLAEIRRIIIRVLREFNQAQIVIIGDAKAYHLFDSIPENRRLYLPPVSWEDYPYLLSQIDILLLPLRNTPYNQSLSDLPLVEAGVKMIPWIASPISSFKAWQVGGLIARSPNEWHTYLREMVMDAGLRKSMGQTGKLWADEREACHIGSLWSVTIGEVLSAKQESRATASSQLKTQNTLPVSLPTNNSTGI